MSLKSIRENYSRLLTALNDAGLKLNESQKSDLDSFIMSLESTISEQRIKAIRMAKKLTESKMQKEYRKVFESVMKHTQENNMLQSKIQSKIEAMKQSSKIADKVDSYLDMYAESVCPKKVIVDYAKMKKLEKVNESLREVLLANDEAVEHKKARLEESFKKEKGKLETEVAKMQVKLNESIAKSKELKKKLSQYKAFELLESKTKDLPTFEARKIKKHFAKSSADEIEKNFSKVYESVKDQCKAAADEAETALQDEVEKIIDSEEVEENDILRNRPHNGHVSDPSAVLNEKDEEDFETTESVKFNENGDVELEDDDVIDENVMDLYCKLAESIN